MMSSMLTRCCLVSLACLCVPSFAVCQEKQDGEYPQQFKDLFVPGRIIQISVQRDGLYRAELYNRPSKVSSKIVAQNADYFVVKSLKYTQYVPYQSILMVTEFHSSYLDTPITQIFKRTPLQEFIATISKDIGMEIRIDADALKHEGYTMNMPQEVTADKTPARALLKELLQRYPALVLTAHDDHYLLTSQRFAVMGNMEVVEYQSHHSDKK